ncbi:hypothetical protein C8R47DRAFT_1127752 [Mycena vitilis]|nr:hypothetical protein C8R47DRAFT_1127752 [Mycena vitilis]
MPTSECRPPCRSLPHRCSDDNGDNGSDINAPSSSSIHLPCSHVVSCGLAFPSFMTAMFDQYAAYDPYAETDALRPLHRTDSTPTPNESPPPQDPGKMNPSEPTDADHTLIILLTGSAILLCTILVALGLLIEVFVVHVHRVTAGAIYTTAPLGQTLTIAHTSAIVISMSAPISVGLGAYWLAGRWLLSSRNESKGRNRPTPYQLGVLMETLHGANLSALWKSFNYILGRGEIPGDKALARPPFLLYAILMLLVFLGLAYGCAGADVWLGATSDAVLYPVTTQLQLSGGSLSSLSRQVNQTLCDEWKDSAMNQPYQCGLIRGTGGNPAANSAQLLTLNGMSGDNIIALTNDSEPTAIMVPPATTLSPNLQYSAKTFGVRSSCSSVTAQCVNTTSTGSNAGLNTNCSSVNYYPSFNGCDRSGGTARTSGGPLSPNGTVLPCSENPNSVDIRFGVTIQSFAYNLNNSNDAFIGDTGFFVHGNAGGTNILICNIKSLEVTYRYHNGTYKLLASGPSDLAQGQRVSDGSQVAPQYVPPAVEGVGLFSGHYNDSFASKLSQVALAMTSYAMEPTDALDMQSIELKIGSRLPLAPFLLVLLISCFYCITVILVTVLAIFEIRRSPQAALARSRLIDPATVISTAYGPDRGKFLATLSTHELFGEESDTDRLTLSTGVADGLPVVRKVELARRHGRQNLSSDSNK